VTAIGVVNGINTSGWNSGDRLYLSTTNGQLTNVPPTPPHISKLVATALNSTNNGRIFVMASNSLATDTTLSNGDNIAPTTNAVKRYVISQGFLDGGDTVGLSNRINLKLNSADTASLSNRINLKLNSSDTASLSNRINLKLNSTDTASLSNRINTKLNSTDTASLSNRINARIPYSDTATTIVTRSNTATLTNKRITYRTGGAASYTTSVTIAADSVDMFVITAQTTALLFNAPSGTPTQGQMLLIRIKDNGTARALTWNAIWRSGTNVTLPTTTVLSKTLYMEFLYNENDTKWDIVGVANGY